jgi:hypothetical protein
VRSGKGICRYCNSDFPFDGPALLYLIADHNAVKIGCAKPGGDRLAAHGRYGWVTAWSIELETGDAAYNLEQAILLWWRNELGLPTVYSKAEMPQSGATETAPWEDMPPGRVLTKVLQLMEEADQGEATIHVQWPDGNRPSQVVTGMGSRARRKLEKPAQPALFELAPD